MIDYSYVRDNSLWDRLGIDRLCNEVVHFDKWYVHYHTSDHTNCVMEYIQQYYTSSVPNDIYEMVMIAAFFHDIGYDPSSEDAVADSLRIFDESVKNKDCLEYKLIRIAIESTRYNNLVGVAGGEVGKLLARADCQDIVHCDMVKLAINAKLMLKEYQMHRFMDFVEGNRNILDHVGDAMSMRDRFQKAINFNDQFYKANQFHFGIYAGTFNPFHVGHKSVLMKAYPLFDKIIVACPKVTERVGYHPKVILSKRFEVIEFEGLFPDFVNQYIQIYPNVRFTIIRGIRHSIDLQYEQDLQKYYKELGLPVSVDIVYMSADPKVAHISGTSVRDIMKVNPDKAAQYIPDKL